MISYKTTDTHLDIDQQLWNKANRKLLSKSIGELMHEQIANPEIINEDTEGITYFKLRTDFENTSYTFAAAKRRMDYWHVLEESIKKIDGEHDNSDIDVPTFFLENQKSFNIEPFTLARYTEELFNTLYADITALKKGRLSALEMANTDYQTLESQMEGHPWIIVNKGRIGFSSLDYSKYAPESGKTLKLLWLAAHKSSATFHSLDDITAAAFYKGELGAHLYHSFTNHLTSLELNPLDYIFIPVHEWQWDNRLAFQFIGEISKKRIVLLGSGEDVYKPQQSIRTLFNTSNPKKNYTKTALSILNTGNIRGLSPLQMKIAPKITKWVLGMLSNDSYLESHGLILLGEIATVSYLHPLYNAIEKVPYQYNEMLGSLWRESAYKFLKKEEQLMTMAALLYVDDTKHSLIQVLAKKSGLAIEAWVAAYLKAYLKPLLHIYYKHSLCVTPHGENIILVMKDYVPQRIIIKDFVDDIVLTAEAREKLPPQLADGLIQSSNEENVPLFILIGVFDAYFRYLSNVLHVYSNYKEQDFWELVTAVIYEYQSEHPDLAWKFDKYDLFTPEFKRFYINGLRLHQGYDEQTGFATPKKGGKLENPIARHKR